VSIFLHSTVKKAKIGNGEENILSKGGIISSMHKEERHNLYSSPESIRGLDQGERGWRGMCCFWERLKIAKFHTLCKEHAEKRSFRRPKHRWKNNIIMGSTMLAECIWFRI
jgi:hypothetical protein